MNLPKSVNKTLFVCVGLGRYNHGAISVHDYNPTTYQSDGFEAAMVSTVNIDIELPESFDAETHMIEVLEAKKSKMEADHYVAIKKIDDDIAKLKSITHSGGEE